MATAEAHEPKSTADEDLEHHLTKTVLSLEEIDVNLYRGVHLWQPPGNRAVFGGQIVGQALVAAGKTVEPDLHVHSLHCYFIRPGDSKFPVLYHVERTRDGRSFCTRSVKAQQQGRPILTMQVSYNRHEEGGLEHQYTMPEAPPPEGLQDREELLKEFLEISVASNQTRLFLPINTGELGYDGPLYEGILSMTDDMLVPSPMHIKSGLATERQKIYLSKVLVDEIPVEVRPVYPKVFHRVALREPQPPKQLLWVKVKGHIADLEDMNLHRCMAAYMSDWMLLSTALLVNPRMKVTMMASLDHSLWFHSPFRADEWMLYECESPRSGDSRALTLGRLWKQDGTLAVSVAQEGVIRLKKPEAKL